MIAQLKWLLVTIDDYIYLVLLTMPKEWRCITFAVKIEMITYRHQSSELSMIRTFHNKFAENNYGEYGALLTHRPYNCKSVY